MSMSLYRVCCAASSSGSASAAHKVIAVTNINVLDFILPNCLLCVRAGDKGHIGHPGPCFYRTFRKPKTIGFFLRRNRFAIYLRLVSAESEKVTVVAMWFPKGYFTPRERPLNYREVQQLLGRT